MADRAGASPLSFEVEPVGEVAVVRLHGKLVAGRVTRV